MEFNRGDLHYCKMISGEITGGLSAGEKKELDDWIKASPRNRELYGRFTDRIAVLRRIETYGEIPVDYYLRRIIYRINTFEAVCGRYPRRRRRLSWTVAAIVVVSAGSLIFDTFRGSFSNPIRFAAEQVIRPGSPEAVLVIGDEHSLRLSRDTEDYPDEFDDMGIYVRDNSIDYTRAAAYRTPAETHKIMVPRGGEYLAVLSDGSRVYLNSESVLEYPISFGSDDRREVRLEGEGYFEICGDPQKPFVIHSNHMTVFASDAEFNVRTYTDENYTAATLIRGTLRVAATNTGTVSLSASQKAVSVLGSEKITLSQVDARQYTGLKDGLYAFRDTRLEEIINTLRRWYGFDAVFDERADDLLFTGRIDRSKSVYTFFDILEATGKIKVTTHNRVVTFTFCPPIRNKPHNDGEHRFALGKPDPKRVAHHSP